MADNPTRFPLAWPSGRPRHKAHERKPGRFEHDRKPITLARAMDRLDGELNRLGARYVVLSTNVELNLNGSPRSSAPRPADPGACVYFRLDDKPHAMGCDRYDSPQANVAALAAHIAAMRTSERHGVATAAESLQAFAALPPPAAQEAPQRPWDEVLGLRVDGVSEALVEAAFRALAKTHHPDGGGDPAKWLEINHARRAAMAAIRSRDLCGND